VSTSAPNEELLRHIRVVRELGARTPGTYLGEGEDGSKLIFETYPVDATIDGTAQRLVGLRHPHLVSVISVERIGGAWSVVTEHVDGLPLEEVFYGLSLGGRLRAVVDVLTALSALHVVDGNSPIVHRGVLLRSAFIEKSGRTKLGFAYRGALCVGKDSYAPEVLLSDAGAIGVRSDVYGAGVLLWEAIAGRPLFGADAPERVVKKQLAGRVDKALPAPADRWAHCVLPVIDRALSVDPKARFATIAEMAAALRIAVRARLMFHEDIIEEVWPAETLPKTTSGVQPSATRVSEAPAPAVQQEPLAMERGPAEEGASSGIVPLATPTAPPTPARTSARPVALAVAAFVAFIVLFGLAIAAVTLTARPQAAPAQHELRPPVSTAPTVTTTVEHQDEETSSAPAATPDPPSSAPVHPAEPHKSLKRPSSKPDRGRPYYDPSSI
jgi:hypothetical protein